MPQKLMPDPRTYPSLVTERAQAWGRYIHFARYEQRLTAAELAARAQVSPSTLRRLEQGDPGAAAGAYLAVLNVLGALAELAPLPALPPQSRATMAGKRVRHAVRHGGGDSDDDF